ncbi:MAG: response regulator [Methanoregula sp.]|nr:response regulator [Methanoregula sp.]
MPPRKIVIIEDDQPILDLMEILIEKLGYQPILITNGLEALDYVRSEPPVLILLDIMMSPISGWEFLKRLRKDYNLWEIPVLLFTAAPDSAEQMAELRDPHLGILQKPVSMEELKAALEKYIR